MYIILILTAVILQLLDGWTTKMVILQGGREANPIAKFGMKLLGYWGYFIARATLVLILCSYAVSIGSQWVLWVVLVMSVAVVAWNWHQTK